MTRHSLELKKQICLDYQKGVFGYRKLSKKYGLTRDTIRYIILHQKGSKNNPLRSNMSTNKKQIYDPEYLKTALEYWKTYAKNLEKHLEEECQNKKKLKFQQSVHCKKETLK